jgi:anti-sigma factor RsiW
MRCRKIRKLLESFMDGELSQELQDEVTLHLKGCPACRAELESIQKAEALSRQLAQVEPDQVYWSTFLPRLRSKIARMEQEPARTRVRKALGKLLAPPLPWPRLAGAVAVALLVVILGRALIRHEIHMRRIRSLPKKLLSEQAQIATRESPTEKGVDLQPPAARGGRIKLPEEQPPKPTTPSPPEVPKSAGDMPSPREEPESAPVSPTPQEDLLPTADQISQPPEPAPQVKALEFQALDQMDERSLTREDGKLPSPGQAIEEEKALMNMTRAVGSYGPEYLRQQIIVWQNSIHTHPRSEKLGQSYFHLSESWYQLALMTGRRADLLQAVETQRAALDFATEESTRKLLRSRIQVLEERLRKK